MLLAGDIGGTKTVLALYDPQLGPRTPINQKKFPSRDFDSLEAVIAAYLNETRASVTHAAFGVAGPIVGDRAQITNLPWLIDRGQIASTFSWRDVHLLNDLEAVATSIPILEEGDVAVLNKGKAELQGAIAVVAPGTGLGEGFLVWDGSAHHAFPCEGGHTDFAPVGELQRDLLAYLQERHDHVSYERVCSGLGMPNLYEFLRDSGRYEEPPELAHNLSRARDRTPLIVHAAQQDGIPICVAVLELFTDILARAAGNLALTVLATGGVYLGGGIPPRILSNLRQPRFMETFASKGRFRKLLVNIPIKVICRTDAALLGVAYDVLRMGSS